MPIDYSKWDNLEDSDDEAPAAKKKANSPSSAAKENKPPPPPGKAPGVIAPGAEESAKPLDDAPELDETDTWQKFYVENMTAPQRMQTLIYLWNSAPQEERVVFLRHLIDLLKDPKVSNRIKGGQEILKDLDDTFYSGVTYPLKWVEQFKSGKLEVDQKKKIFERLFKVLPAQEQGVVLGTLSA